MTNEDARIAKLEEALKAIADGKLNAPDDVLFGPKKEFYEWMWATSQEKARDALKEADDETEND